jgi:hypothetical protein
MTVVTSPEAGSVEPAQLTISYTEGDDGWITAQVVEYPAAISQGRSRHEAWVNVLDALHDLTHEPTASEKVAYTVQARIVEPIAAVLHKRLGRHGDRLFT